MKLYDDPKEEHIVWKIRESGLGATARVPGEQETWEGWEDSAVPPEHVGRYLRDFRKLLERYGYRGALYGHIGQGCVHTRINLDLVTAPGVRKFRSFIEDASDVVLRYGGLKTPPMWCCAMAGRFPANMATGNRAPNYFQRCLDRNWSKLFANSRRCGIRNGN